MYALFAADAAQSLLKAARRMVVGRANHSDTNDSVSPQIQRGEASSPAYLGDGGALADEARHRGGRRRSCGLASFLSSNFTMSASTPLSRGNNTEAVRSEGKRRSSVVHPRVEDLQVCTGLPVFQPRGLPPLLPSSSDPSVLSLSSAPSRCSTPRPAPARLLARESNTLFCTCAGAGGRRG